MSPALLAFLLQQVLPFVLQNLPAFIQWLEQNAPELHQLAQNAMRAVTIPAASHVARDQGPNFDWHSGP